MPVVPHYKPSSTGIRSQGLRINFPPDIPSPPTTNQLIHTDKHSFFVNDV